MSKIQRSRQQIERLADEVERRWPGDWQSALPTCRVIGRALCVPGNVAEMVRRIVLGRRYARKLAPVRRGTLLPAPAGAGRRG